MPEQLRRAESKVARFFVAQLTKAYRNGVNIPKDHKINPKPVKCTKPP
jgi:hypothetical protein